MIYLAFPPAASMTSLNLSGNIMEPKGVSVLAQSLRSLHVLEELYLGHNWIGDAGMEAISEALSKLDRLRVLRPFAQQAWRAQR